MTDSLHREYAPWLKVLQHFCDSTVVSEFNALKRSGTGKETKLLDCLKSVVHSISTTHELNKEEGTQGRRIRKGLPSSNREDGGDGEGLKLLRDAFKSCGASPSLLKGSFFNQLKTHLSTWAVRRTKEEVMFQHHMIMMQTRVMEQRNNCIASHITDAAVVKETNWNTVDFGRLKKVPVSSLELFQTAIGKYIEGEIITSPVVFVGATIIIQDDFGNHVQLTLYNAVPTNSPDKLELASAKFPMGSKIRVAEPFFKIFQDGNRGVRVESLSEVQVFKDSAHIMDMTAVRRQGRTLVSSGDLLGAIETYQEATTYFATDVVTLLNNRCQAQIRLEQYEEAVLDAAAALFLDEGNEKAKHRYKIAVSKLSSDDGSRCSNKRRNYKEAWQTLLEYSSTAPPLMAALKANKEEGNRAFRVGQWEEARRQYTGSLHNHFKEDVENLCVLLTNIAVVCLKTEMFQTAISAANTSLRIAAGCSDAAIVLTKKKAVFAMTKAFSMLGELELAELASLGDETLEDFWSDSRKPIRVLFRILECLPQFEDVGWDKTYSIGVEDKGGKNDLPIDYVALDALRHVYVPGKGRGLVACRDIHAQEVLVIDRMVLKCTKGDMNEDKGFVLSMNTKTRLIEPEQRAKLISRLLRLVKHNGLLAKKLLLMEWRKHHRIFKDKPLPLVEDLQWMGHRAMSFDLGPFLPQTPSQVGVDVGKVTFKFVEGLIGINEFGWHTSDSKVSNDAFFGQKGVSVMTRVSLLNHDFNANCRHFAMGDCMVVVAQRDIKEGQELTLKYGEDVNKWQINN